MKNLFRFRHSILIFLFCMTTLNGVFAIRALAQGCDVTITYASGSGTACASYGTIVTLTSGAGGPADQHYNISFYPNYFSGGGVWMYMYAYSGWTNLSSDANVIWNTPNTGPCGYGLGAVYPSTVSSPLDFIPQEMCIMGINSQTSFTIDVIFYPIGSGATPTPAPTPVPSPGPAVGSQLRSCGLLGNTLSNFENLPSAWSLSPTTLSNPTGTTAGVSLPDSSSSAETPVGGMIQSHQYALSVRYHTSEAGDPGDFVLSVGRSPEFHIPVTAIPDVTQVFDVPAANYEPTSLIGGVNSPAAYLLSIRGATAPNLIIDFVCLSDVTTATIQLGGGRVVGQSGLGLTPDDADCSLPVYSPVGDLIQDVPQLIGLVFPLVTTLWNCGLLPIGTKMLYLLKNAAYFANVARQWAGQIIDSAKDWVIADLTIAWRWLSGFGSNLFQIGLNLLAGLLNALHLTDLINNIANFIRGIPLFLENAFHTVQALFAIVGDWISRIITAIIGIVGVIPLLFLSMINGFNASASSVPLYAPDCNSANLILYSPCLAFYVLDNTIFDGPVYYIMPVVIGMLGWNTLIWATQTIKENLTK